MRFFIGMILALGFLLAGVIVFFVAVRLALEQGLVDDTYAALFVSGMLMLIGVVFLSAVVRSRKKRASIDAAQISAVTTAHMLNLNDDYGDDFSD